ncbi:MAG: MBL fold metallo-hydrolase [Candidatus Omnitrophica bacterium]|nr:MBL fold metallo-hydrolase [Candidatus Omnitrophota bacterium]MBU4478646.1 MBL fold metallo-hydrolase [Candidatus Omnitrophota bacterium]
MKIIFLGTNGWFDSDTGNTVSTLVKTAGCNIILDAGFGISRADRFLDFEKPTFIFLSHLHLDHIAGLHSLVKFPFAHPLLLFVPPGEKEAISFFMAQPFTIPSKGLPFAMDIRASASRFSCAGVRVVTRRLVHSSTCIGYRFQIGAKTIAYCTDTGVCANALRLAEGADVLITECALRQGQDDEGWPHLDPTHAATMAKEAKVKRLILTHFDAHNYQTLKERKTAQKYARKVFPATIAAFDGMEISV